VLATLSGNVLKEPDNPKYHHFKSTNNAIRRNLVDVRGALEYAVEVSYILAFTHQNPSDQLCTYHWQMGFHRRVRLDPYAW
jgi:hypothetical protein